MCCLEAWRLGGSEAFGSLEARMLGCLDAWRLGGLETRKLGALGGQRCQGYFSDPPTTQLLNFSTTHLPAFQLYRKRGMVRQASILIF
jgi:hypothetical protein